MEAKSFCFFVVLANVSWKHIRPKFFPIPISIFFNAHSQSGKSNQTPVSREVLSGLPYIPTPPSIHILSECLFPLIKRKPENWPLPLLKLSVLNYLTLSNGWFTRVHNPDSMHWFLTLELHRPIPLKPVTCVPPLQGWIEKYYQGDNP